MGSAQMHLATGFILGALTINNPLITSSPHLSQVSVISMTHKSNPKNSISKMLAITLKMQGSALSNYNKCNHMHLTNPRNTATSQLHASSFGGSDPLS